MIFLIFVYLLMPCVAFAYLDPGTGAVLVNLLIAGVATLAFFFRGVFFRLIGKKDVSQKAKKTQSGISIFSEGKQYWTTFEPIISALIEQNIDFRYYTSDVHDPALLIENDYMESRFLGYGNFALAKVSRIKANILLSTTPNIGTPGYPVQKSPYINKLIHVFHASDDISWYKTGSLDHYDEVILGGDYQGKAIRELENKRKLEVKKLVSLGLPYLDIILKKKLERQEISDDKTILIGASWGDKGLFSYYGSYFIETLADKGYRLIVRPHPQSYQSEAELMRNIETKLSKYDNITWDKSMSPAESLAAADLLISDTSALRFDFAFIYEKPVITLDIPKGSIRGYEIDDLSEVWMDDAADEIGIVVPETEVNKLNEIIDRLLAQDYVEKIRQYRGDLINNFGNAGYHIAKYLAESNEGGEKND